ncbi:MurR/RpiR family transcriptional regulator [Bauldia sp.]|uniref:MurR/RpiR family transcriptional regulator n=1 Tax=Bauldia sp. TaxID=2575872 RepID=UPI003BACFCC2
MTSSKKTRDKTAPVESYGDLVDRLKGRQDSLSKRLQQVAQFFMNNPEDVALYNIVELAGQAGVPPSAITRFSKEMGFAGFNDLQHVFRQRLVGPRVAYADRFKSVTGASKTGAAAERASPPAIFDVVVQAGMDSLVRLSEDIDRRALTQFVKALDAAAAVHIVAARGAYGVGGYCYYGLSRIGKSTHLIDNVGSMREEQLGAVGSGDVVLAITFDDYTPETIEIATHAAKRGLTVLVITDNELSPIAKVGKRTLYVKEAHLGHFRSQVPAMVLCQSVIMSLAQTRSPS